MIYSLGELARELSISKEGLKQWLNRQPDIEDRRMQQGMNRARYFTQQDREEILMRRGHNG